jgi:TctA family transporter
VEAYLSALVFLLDPMYWLVLLAGVLLVGALGILPGIGGPSILAIILPFLIFNVSDPVIGLTFLAAMAGLGNSLDSVPAVLLGIPSTGNQVTFLEGHQLAMQGKSAYTLGALYAVSAIGGLVGAVALLISMPFLRPFMLSFSFPEIAAMAVFGVLMVAALSRGTMLKGIIAGLFGILLGTVGTSTIAPAPRFDLGLLYLFDGLPLLPTLIGIFALPEMIDLMMRNEPISQPGSVSNRQVFEGARYGVRQWPMTVRQSVFGVFLGAVPGIGSAVVDWLAYALGVALAKDKSGFGRGRIDGVLFAESAQNAKEGGQIIPTLAFGVPGGTSWAIVLVAMTAYGVVPGLGMLDPKQHLNVTMSMVATLALGNLFMTLLALGATGQMAKLTLIPYSLLASALVPLMFISAYQSNQSWGDILIVLISGVLGLAMKWFGWPRPPLVLGFILGPVIESNLWPAVQIWGVLGILARPVTLVLAMVGIASALYLTWMMGAMARTEKASLPIEAARAPDARATLLRRWFAGSCKFRWHNELLFSLLLLVASLWALQETQHFAAVQARFLPQWLLTFMIPLQLLQVARVSFGFGAQGQVMDLGMRTGTDATATRRLFAVLVWVVSYIAAVAIVGMPWASIGFALVFALVHCDAKPSQYLWATVPALLMALIIFGLFEGGMYVEWPARVELPFSWLSCQ